MDPSTHTVYVTTAGSNIVSVISEATNTVTAAINMGVGNRPEAWRWTRPRTPFT